MSLEKTDSFQVHVQVNGTFGIFIEVSSEEKRSKIEENCLEVILAPLLKLYKLQRLKFVLLGV